MPSVLIETGFITNTEEEGYLTSKEGQDYLASAIFRATRDYINEVDKKSNISTLKETAETATLTDSLVTEKGTENDELKFMVQINSSARKKEVKPENFRGLTEVTEIASDNRFRYATGSFKEYSEAVKYRKIILNIYPDAFVIAVKDNKILPLQDALKSTQNKQR